ncbi:MAG: transglutaminase-like domain-containing protein [Pseudomonadota bacterium]
MPATHTGPTGRTPLSGLPPYARRGTRPTVERLLDPVERAIALHDWVRDEIRFGWGPRFFEETPAQTQRRRVGYSVTKSAALVQAYRLEGLEARMVFAEIDAEVLRGVLGPGPDMLDHAFVEVRLAGEWIAFDSHIVDTPLRRAAQRRLAAEGRHAGYGTHLQASGQFPNWSQFVPAARGRVWGSYSGAPAFLASGTRAHNRVSWLARRAFGAIASRANGRLDALRGIGSEAPRD